jgi:uncharacterized protein
MKKPTKAKRIELRQIPDNEIVVMKHKWRDLLFLHWTFDPIKIQATLPEGLYVDTFDGKAYIGLTPFFLFDVRPVFFPSIPFLSDFLEVNVRTYVHDEKGTPGVWFYSLDANQPLGVKLAQQIHLPYKHAEIEASKIYEEISFKIKRKNIPDNSASEFSFAKSGEEFFADSDSLEFFLVERYLLFSYDIRSKKLYSLRVHHPPYPLYNTELTKWDTNLLSLAGLEPKKNSPDHIIMSTGVDVDIYNIKKVQ